MSDYILFRKIKKHPNDGHEQNIGLEEIENVSTDERHKKYYVCSDHFELIMYPHQLLSTSLKRGAVPTILHSDAPSKKLRRMNVESQSTASTSKEPDSCTKHNSEVKLPNEDILPDKEIEHSYCRIVIDTSLKSVQTQTSRSLTTSTPRKKKYKNQISTLKKQLKMTDKKQNTQIPGIDTQIQGIDEEQFFSFLNHHFDDKIATFVKTQFNLSKKKKRGERYPAQFKQFALQLYFLGPKVYKFLRKTFRLPAKNTLLRYTHAWDLPPGLNNFLFEVVKLKLQHLTETAKHCVLCFDEISIKSHLFYNRSKDQIFGFHDTKINKSFKPATDALVVMARGIYSNWKQPLGYFFVNNTCKNEELEEIVTNSIRRARDTGLKVVVVITYQGPNFYGLTGQLNITPEHPYFVVDDEPVFYMFDSPHLLKSIRNPFFSNHIVTPDGTTDFKYFENYYKHMKNLRHRNSYKLTDQHVYPSRFEKMKVRYASQVFSQSVAGGMALLMSTGYLPADADATIELIDKMDKIFDFFNSSPISEKSDKEFAAPYCAEQKQERFLEEMVNYFQNIKVVNKNGSDVTNKVRCVKGWLLNISTLSALWKKYRNEGNLYTRRLNQDCLENFFAQVRQCGGPDKNPTPIKFMASFKKLFCMNFFEHSGGANCVDDLDSVLLTLENYPQLERNYENLFEERHIFTPLTVEATEYTSAEYPLENALFYICGYLFKKCLLQHSCSRCLQYSQMSCEINEFTQQVYHISRHHERKNSFEGLTMPAIEFYYYIRELDDRLCEQFESFALNVNVGSRLKEMLEETEFVPPCEHFPMEYLLSLFVRMRIFHLIKFANMELANSQRKKKKRDKTIILQHL